MMNLAELPHRAVVEIAGADRVSFLQGLVSNDVTQAEPGRAVWAALLTPQGKWLADFFVLAHQDTLLLDCERQHAAMLVQRLGRYRLRASVALREAAWHVYAGWGERPLVGLVVPDPRLPDAGFRVLAAETLAVTADFAAWDARRIALGLPDGSRDMESEKSVLLEGGFDELGGVSWTKGCYMGQELTARTKYRGLVKRRLLPVALSAAAAPGALVTRDGQEAGVLRSVCGQVALALLRIDAVDGPLICEGAPLSVAPPAWIDLERAA